MCQLSSFMQRHRLPAGICFQRAPEHGHAGIDLLHGGIGKIEFCDLYGHFGLRKKKPVAECHSPTAYPDISTGMNKDLKLQLTSRIKSQRIKGYFFVVWKSSLQSHRQCVSWIELWIYSTAIRGWMSMAFDDSRHRFRVHGIIETSQKTEDAKCFI